MELGSRGDALSFSRVVSAPVQAVNSVTSSKAGLLHNSSRCPSRINLELSSKKLTSIPLM